MRAVSCSISLIQSIRIKQIFNVLDHETLIVIKLITI